MFCHLVNPSLSSTSQLSQSQIHANPDMKKSYWKRPNPFTCSFVVFEYQRFHDDENPHLIRLSSLFFHRTCKYIAYQNVFDVGHHNSYQSKTYSAITPSKTGITIQVKQEHFVFLFKRF